MPDPFDRAAEILLAWCPRSRLSQRGGEVGRKDGAVWRRAFGALTYEPDSADDHDRHGLRSRVADEADRDDHARDACRRRGACSR